MYFYIMYSHGNFYNDVVILLIVVYFFNIDVHRRVIKSNLRLLSVTSSKRLNTIMSGFYQGNNEDDLYQVLVRGT